MDTLRRLCEGQNSDTQRKILAAYYRGCADGLKVPRERPRTDTRQLPTMLRNQAD